MTITYYTIFNPDGSIPKAQAKKLGTKAYGFKSYMRAWVYCPNGGIIQERHTDGSNDWAGREYTKEHFGDLKGACSERQQEQ